MTAKRAEEKKGTQGNRVAIPRAVRHEVISKSRRRCCMCFGLKGDMDLKKGQIAHLDRKRVNPKQDNLAFLCEDCHTLYDTKSNRVLAYTPDEVRHYRDLLYEKLADDWIEWCLTMRAHRDRYDNGRAVVDRAKAILLKFSKDVTTQEGPADLR